MSLLTALKSGNERLVETICASGASPNQLDDDASPMHIVVGLHVANVKQLTKILLQYGGDPNVENGEHLTPLHVSIIRGNSKVLHLLLRNGGDPTKQDEEGRDAWDYALKYCRTECQKILSDYIDEETLAGSDEEQNKYVSIFYQDVPLKIEDSNWSSMSTGSNLLNTQHSFSRNCNFTQMNSLDTVDYQRQSPPRPPPRRRSKFGILSDQNVCMCPFTPPDSSRVHTYPSPCRVHTYPSPNTSTSSRTGKSHKGLLSSLRKSLSPSSKPRLSSSSKPRLSPSSKPRLSLSSKPRLSPSSKLGERAASTSASPSTSLSSASSKSKYRSPLTLLRSPSKTSKFARTNSSIDSAANTVRFDLRDQSRLVRSYSVPSESVAGKSSRAHGGGSPGKRQHLESCGGSNQMYSPSNYCTTTGKPDQHKKLESPFQLKQRKGSKKSLLKRLLGSTASSPDENPGCITIGLGQTLTLSERTGRDSVSILSLESAERGREGCTADERGSEGRTADERGREGCTADERGRGTAVSRTLSYGEISGIESGDKVFDVTSPDHCVVVDVDTPPSPLEDTVLSPLENTVPSPLKDTALSPPVKDTSYSLIPPQKPKRLFISADASGHRLLCDEVDSGGRSHHPVRQAYSSSSSQTSERRTSPQTSKGVCSRTGSVSAGDVQGSRRQLTPYRTVNLQTAPTDTSTITTSLGGAATSPGGATSSLGGTVTSSGIDNSSTTRPSDLRRIQSEKDGVLSSTPSSDLRGNLAAELEQTFRCLQRRLLSQGERKNGILEGGRSHVSGEGEVVSQGEREVVSQGERGVVSQGEREVVSQGEKEVRPVRLPRSKEIRASGFSNKVVQSTSDSSLTCTKEAAAAQSCQLTHRWSVRKAAPVLKRQQNVENNGCLSEVRVSLSKDSGIDSTPTVHSRRQRRVTTGSDDSFHTCLTNTNSASDEKPQSADHNSLGGLGSDPLSPLPTEVDSLQAKVSRMNLEDFCPVASDDSESDMVEGGDNSICLTTVQPSSICASDGSVAEYLHTDLETSITLTEARWPITCAATTSSRKSIHWKSFSELSFSVDDSFTSSAPAVVPRDVLHLSDAELVKELVELGDVPGPITVSTRKIYQLRLSKLRSNPHLCTPNKYCSYSKELQQFMAPSVSISLAEISQWEHEMMNYFESSSGRKWREGNSKMSFNYLLLDPRTTKNLPARCSLLDSDSKGEAFKVFISAIFYIGKGKKTRPYQHFIEAIKNKSDSKKTRQILDIWKCGLGVVSLHVFHNILPVEAYTREACMVDSMNLKNLANQVKGTYYGAATTWSVRRRRLVGAELLRKSYNILLIEGERQIRPADVRDESELPSFLV